MMGHGDDIMATGFARGAWRRGKRIAFGDGKQIIWGPFSKDIFRNNKNIAPPGSERDSDIEWIAYHKHNRQYNRVSDDRTRWVWNMNFRPKPGEIYFDAEEIRAVKGIEPGYILIEPNVPNYKSVAVNKQWPIDRWQAVADCMLQSKRRVVQLVYDGARYELGGVEVVECPNFRTALSYLAHSIYFLGHEGGMHHGAAALGIPGVVIFGGFIPPVVTGYPLHINLTGGANIACGSLNPCEHCRRALDAINIGEVIYHIERSFVHPVMAS